jgi:hypothetical protein
MISVKLRGIEELNSFLKSLPRGTMRDAVKAMAEYFIGNEQHGLKHYPGYKYVSRIQDYGVSFFTDKQRRWFFWALKSGKLNLPYQRTNNLRDGWQMSVDPYRKTVFNRVPYSKHVMGDATQSRHPAKIGWRTTSKVLADNMTGAMRAATLAVERWIKNKGKV